MTITDKYEKAVVNLALRQYSLSQIQEALKCYGAGKVSDGESAEDNAKTSTRIADRLQAEG